MAQMKNHPGGVVSEFVAALALHNRSASVSVLEPFERRRLFTEGKMPYLGADEETDEFLQPGKQFTVGYGSDLCNTSVVFFYKSDV